MQCHCGIPGFTIPNIIIGRFNKKENLSSILQNPQKLSKRSLDLKRWAEAVHQLCSTHIKTDCQWSRQTRIKCWQNWRKKTISIFSCQKFCSESWHFYLTWSSSWQTLEVISNNFYALSEIPPAQMTFERIILPRSE